MKHIALIGLWALVSLKLSLAASELKFDASGHPIRLLLGGVECLDSKSPGFVLRTSKEGKVIETPLSGIVISGDLMTVSHPDGKPSFTFEVKPYDKHLAIHLIKAEGIGNGREHALSLAFDTEDLAAYTLNDLMTENTGTRRRRNT